MKKRLLFIVWAALCLNFSTALAQDQKNKAVDVTSRGIQIGEKVPITSSLTPYKGKLIILDFWATWCSPCVAMIPKLEDLQSRFKDEISIVPITYQSENEVTAFLQKLRKGQPSVLPNITGDKQFHKQFPHVVLPHYVWIDEGGTVRAITGHEEVTAENIEKMLSSGNIQLKRKADMRVAFDKNLPLFINGNGGVPEKLKYHSLLSGYQQGLAGGYDFIKNDSLGTYRLSAYNNSMIQLYRIAFLDKGYLENNRTVIECKDSSTLKHKGPKAELKTWLVNNTYCYERMVPKSQHKTIFAGIKADLDQYFTAYDVSVEKRRTKCYMLSHLSNVDKLKSKSTQTLAGFNVQGFKMQHMPLSRLIAELAVIYQQNSPYPIIDGTNYKEPVDMEVSANLTNMESINAALARYDLRFELKEQELDLLIIRDKK